MEREEEKEKGEDSTIFEIVRDDSTVLHAVLGDVGFGLGGRRKSDAKGRREIFRGVMEAIAMQRTGRGRVGGRVDGG